MGERYGKNEGGGKRTFFPAMEQKETGEKDWEELEELLIQADMGPALSLEIVEKFREFKKSRGGDDWQEWLYQKLFSLLEGSSPLFLLLLKKEN